MAFAVFPVTTAGWGGCTGAQQKPAATLTHWEAFNFKDQKLRDKAFDKQRSERLVTTGFAHISMFKYAPSAVGMPRVTHATAVVVMRGSRPRQWQW